MDYEKKYEVALEIAREALNDGTISSNTIAYIQDIFPELKESEDERIRNRILLSLEKDLMATKNSGCNTQDLEQCIAWLEKQGEQKPFDYENANIQQKDFAPKQEPKFHEGEWLAENHPNNYARFVQILEIVNVQGKNRYRISRDLHNDEDITECRFIEDNWHPFNIQDAKDGDVLYSQCCKLLWIYKNEKTCHVGSNLNYNSGSIVVNKPICIPTDVHPTTKEQRDALFAKMKEAGYEWDADKKELKKISQRMVSAEAKEAMYDKPTNEEMIEALRTEYEKGRADAIAEMQKGWSEEDECILFRIINDLKFLKDTISIDPNYAVNITDIEREIDWLKSLKDRCTWKPSDEQIRALEYIINNAHNTSYSCKIAKELLEELKKLKE